VLPSLVALISSEGDEVLVPVAEMEIPSADMTILACDVIGGVNGPSKVFGNGSAA
jgi:hypothetical protein